MDTGWSSGRDGRITREVLLRRAAFGGVGLGMAGLLAACGDSDDNGGSSATSAAATGAAPSDSAPASSAAETTAAGDTSAAGSPNRGGNLRVGMVGNGTAETMDPGLGVVPIDASRAFNHFEGLVWVDQQNVLQPRLATEWSTNADATEYQIKLREGVTWHDGSPFTADDVIFTFNAMGDPAHYGHSAVVGIDLAGLKKVSDLELTVPLTAPNGRLLDLFAYFNMLIIKNGTTSFDPPVGTGPFKLESFTPGQRSKSVRHDGYWMEGKPYLDSIEIISIDDPGARLNALRAGELDAMDGVPAPDAKAMGDDDPQVTLLRASTPTFYCFYMDTSQPPFDDVKVRQAMMVAIDRQALIDGALSGFGTLGNDLAGRGLELFNTSLPEKEQDLEKAKALLAEAGKPSVDVTLSTSPIFPGFVESATLLAQQVKDAGFNVTIEQVQPGQYLVPPPGGVYLTLQMGQDKWPMTSLQAFYTQALVKDAIYAESHWNNPASDELLAKAIAATDPTEQQDLWNQVQEIQYNEGGNLIWAQPDNLDATAKNVAGLTPGGPFEMGGFSFWDVYFAS